MLLMSSRMFLAECTALGWLGRKGRQSEHRPKAAGADGVELARPDPTLLAAAGAQHTAGLEHERPDAVRHLPMHSPSPALAGGFSVLP